MLLKFERLLLLLGLAADEADEPPDWPAPPLWRELECPPPPMPLLEDWLCWRDEPPAWDDDKVLVPPVADPLDPKPAPFNKLHCCANWS
jgi:hypothetical protein